MVSPTSKDALKLANLLEQSEKPTSAFSMLTKSFTSNGTKNILSLPWSKKAASNQRDVKSASSAERSGNLKFSNLTNSEKSILIKNTNLFNKESLADPNFDPFEKKSLDTNPISANKKLNMIPPKRKPVHYVPEGNYTEYEKAKQKFLGDDASPTGKSRIPVPTSGYRSSASTEVIERSPNGHIIPPEESPSVDESDLEFEESFKDSIGDGHAENDSPSNKSSGYYSSSEGDGSTESEDTADSLTSSSSSLGEVRDNSSTEEEYSEDDWITEEVVMNTEYNSTVNLSNISDYQETHRPSKKKAGSSVSFHDLTTLKVAAPSVQSEPQLIRNFMNTGSASPINNSPEEHDYSEGEVSHSPSSGEPSSAETSANIPDKVSINTRLDSIVSGSPFMSSSVFKPDVSVISVSALREANAKKIGLSEPAPNSSKSKQQNSSKSPIASLAIPAVETATMSTEIAKLSASVGVNVKPVKTKVRHVQIQTKINKQKDQGSQTENQPLLLDTAYTKQEIVHYESQIKTLTDAMHELHIEQEELRYKLMFAESQNEDFQRVIQDNQGFYDQLSAQAYVKLRQVLKENQVLRLELEVKKRQVLLGNITVPKSY